MNDKKGVILERLRNLIDSSGKTRDGIAKAIECDTSTITKHYNGNRQVAPEFIIKYAQFFNVSSDYLLGLPPAESTDRDDRCVTSESQLDYKAEYKRLREENVKLSVENHFLRNAVVSMSIQLFGGAEK